MPENKPRRILFVPVSGTRGIGEYMRSLSIAKALRRQNSSHEITFIVNEQAPYKNDCPFPTRLVKASPTRCTDEVKRIVKEIGPHLVIFDAAGRVAQFAFCQQVGSKVMFIAQQQKKMDKALRWRRLRYLDEVLVAQPPEFMRNLSMWQRFKIKVLAKSPPRCVGPIFSEVHQDEREGRELLHSLGLRENAYVFVCAGGGGNFVKSAGNKIVAADVFADAAKFVAESQVGDHAQKVLLVLGPNYPQHGKYRQQLGWHGQQYTLDACSDEALQFLLSKASTALLGGGSLLMRAIVFGVPHIVACAIASDQKERIKQCLVYDSVVSTELNALSLADMCMQPKKSLAVKKSSISNGLEVCLEQINTLLY